MKIVLPGESPKVPVRFPPRSAAPLPDGPFPVPVSTLDWLLSRDSPAARYVALRDVLGRPAKDLELRKARQAVPRDPFVRDVLPLLRKRLTLSAAEDPEKPYDGGLWLTLFLAEMGADRSLPEIRHAGDVLLARWEKTFIEIERGHPSGSEGSYDPRLFSTVCRTLAAIGHAEDSRVLAGAEHLARKRIAAGGRLPVAKDLLLFAAIPAAKRSPLVERAVAFAVERAIATELPRSGARFGFPAGLDADGLELLDALAALGVARRPELAGALALVAARADRRGRWKLDRILPLPVPLERDGELSRWVTIRALRVMQRFAGLRIVGPG